MIRKEEREQINLKKALKLEEAPQELFQIDTIANLSDLKSSQKVYSRQQYLCKHLNLPGKVNERLTEVLHGMNIPERIIANAVNTDLYDKLRQKILLMFSIQRYIRKKETERRVLDEKRKRLVSQEEDDKKVYMKQNEGLPKKKVHLNKQ